MRRRARLAAAQAAKIVILSPVVEAIVEAPVVEPAKPKATKKPKTTTSPEVKVDKPKTTRKRSTATTTRRKRTTKKEKSLSPKED